MAFAADFRLDDDLVSDKLKGNFHGRFPDWGKALSAEHQ